MNQSLGEVASDETTCTGDQDCLLLTHFNPRFVRWGTALSPFAKDNISDAICVCQMSD